MAFVTCGKLVPMHDERKLALMGSDRRNLVRAATRLLGPVDAEDAVQDAYVRALEADAVQLNVAQAWLLTVVRHLAIDRLRRRRWMDQWLAEEAAGDMAQAAPSAEMDAALAQEAASALRWLAAQLSPADGATVLLHEVFEMGHAELAQAGGRSEAGSRQHLRRALLRLRSSGGAAQAGERSELGAGEEALFRLYLQALQQRNPQALWAMLRHPPISAVASTAFVAAEAASVSPTTACGVTQVGGQLGLVLTLDGVTLCVVPLGVLPEREAVSALP